jgi:multidrug efflux pump subunit AcrA (membrane-fusion protein)
MRNFFSALLILAAALFSCNTESSDSGDDGIQAQTPVTVTSIEKGPLSDTVVLNATSSFLIKTSVKAAINGYLDEVSIRLGEMVNSGQALFRIRSKEGSTLGNIINNVDTSFHFTGLMIVKSPSEGFITRLDHLPGDYVQEGESIATISNARSLVFLLDLPYELRPYLQYNRKVILHLPDGQKITGIVSTSLPFVDPESQTQGFIIYMDKYQQVPENLIARVNFVRNTRQNTVSLPREAVLTDEQQTEFWIMKMEGINTAVKVPIVKGIETANRIEILSPVLIESDIILLTGNYGLPDTARVFIEKSN